jgi:mannitol-1-phosphate 5-dehydrogenase
MAENSIVIFGAGKIGRSFIGQLFGRAGYEVIFIDTVHHIVGELNRRREYPVIIKGPSSKERIIVGNVRAVDAGKGDQVAKEIRDAGILAISVGKKALPAVAPSLARGLLLREDSAPGRILDIILAENMRSAANFLRKQLRKNLPPEYPLEKQVGLVETSIGKMVPIMSEEDLREDPLQVFAEPSNTLILDRKGFRGKIPPIPEFALKDHMRPWVDRKAFIHNLGHAAAAYCGFLKHPGAKYMYEILDDPGVCEFAHRVMTQSAGVLLKVYPEEFTPQELSDHIDDLLERFRNKNLGDTVFRVGCDLRRKLSADDRFMGIIRMAQKLEISFDSILEAMSMGFHFRGRDEQGRLLHGDEEFHIEWKRNPAHLLEEVCGLNAKEDGVLIRKILDLYHRMKKD